MKVAGCGPGIYGGACPAVRGSVHSLPVVLQAVANIGLRPTFLFASLLLLWGLFRAFFQNPSQKWLGFFYAFLFLGRRTSDAVD